MSNPVLNEDTFNQMHYNIDSTEVMSKNGVVSKISILLGITTLTAIMSWYVIAAGMVPFNEILLYGSAIIAAILGFIISFKMNLAPTLSPFYAAFEGVFLGIISLYFESLFPGLVMQAILGTFAVFFTLLVLYASKIIVVTEKFRSTVMVLTIAAAIVYLFSFLMSMFGIGALAIHKSGMIGIGFSLIVMAVASANLLIDFDNIEKGINSFAPKKYEWYCAFGTMVTIVWLYIEILRLLAKLRSRD